MSRLGQHERLQTNGRHADRDQVFLMPPSVAHWLPEGHLAWFIVDVVSEMDLAGFYAGYREDGRGGTAYDPALMVGVLLYAYCLGERSSRLIEPRLVEDVAFRVVAANQCPDHATFARFRRRHEDAIAELFGQVLGLCVTEGLVGVRGGVHRRHEDGGERFSVVESHAPPSRRGDPGRGRGGRPRRGRTIRGGLRR